MVSCCEATAVVSPSDCSPLDVQSVGTNSSSVGAAGDDDQRTNELGVDGVSKMAVHLLMMSSSLEQSL